MPDRPTTPSATGRILVVDDDRRMASGIAQWLCSQGHHASAAGDAAEAVRLLARGGFDAVVVDALLPEGGGAVVAESLTAARPHAAVVAMLPDGAGLPVGLRADAVVTAPARDADLAAALDAARRAAEARATSAVNRPGVVLGTHPAVRRVLDVVERVAATPATILLTGESGTGKSLLAREIHRASGRRGRFVEVACGCLAESLLESELFGHVAGAFTGATGDRDGKFLQADGGTIFLDEIATASPALQVKLLRVLQEMEFEPVGGTITRGVDVRVILATNENLEALVAAGRFRADLFWRINVVAIPLPPLRERASDIPALAAHFLRSAAARAGREVVGFTPAATDALMRHGWPGNVRELEHAVERAVFLGRGRLVDLGDLPAAVASAGSIPRVGEQSIRQALAVPERQLILEALERSGWRRDIAARSLGINRTTLYKKAKRLGLDLAALEPAG